MKTTTKTIMMMKITIHINNSNIVNKMMTLLQIYQKITKVHNQLINTKLITNTNQLIINNTSSNNKILTDISHHMSSNKNNITPLLKTPQILILLHQIKKTNKSKKSFKTFSTEGNKNNNKNNSYKVSWNHKKKPNLSIIFLIFLINQKKILNLSQKTKINQQI